MDAHLPHMTIHMPIHMPIHMSIHQSSVGTKSSVGTQGGTWVGQQAPAWTDSASVANGRPCLNTLLFFGLATGQGGLQALFRSQLGTPMPFNSAWLAASPVSGCGEDVLEPTIVGAGDSGMFLKGLGRGVARHETARRKSQKAVAAHPSCP